MAGQQAEWAVAEEQVGGRAGLTALQAEDEEMVVVETAVAEILLGDRAVEGAVTVRLSVEEVVAVLDVKLRLACVQL